MQANPVKQFLFKSFWDKLSVPDCFVSSLGMGYNLSYTKIWGSQMSVQYDKCQILVFSPFGKWLHNRSKSPILAGTCLAPLCVTLVTFLSTTMASYRKIKDAGDFGAMSPEEIEKF